MDTVVPVAAEQPKSRLAEVLEPAERRAFALAMLQDVLDVLRVRGREPRVLATGPLDVDAPVTVDERPLDPAINDVLASADGAVAVVMADLALVTEAAIGRLFDPDADVVFAPGRGGGTNAIVTRHPEFRVDYHGGSIRDHRDIAREIGASVREVDSVRLATDVDEPADLAEVLLHGEGRSREWLVEAGFELTVVDGRLRAARAD